MKPLSFLGFLVLVLAVLGIFTSLFYAYDLVGSAVKYAEMQKEVVACNEELPCSEGICIDNYCRAIPQGSNSKDPSFKIY